MEVLNVVQSYWWVVPVLLALLFYQAILRLLFGLVMIPEGSIGIVTKKWVLVGSHRTLPDGAVVALNGEAGLQADALASGVHFWLWPGQYSVRDQKFITIREGMIGIVEARDGTPLGSGRVLAKHVNCGKFQDARAFLTGGGERGPQMTVIPPGTYRINTSLFSVAEERALEIPDNMVGVVTTKEGKPLPTGEIAGREVQGHQMYQDAQAFVDAGGFKGLQEQVILAGRYYLNPRFATVEMKEMTMVPIAHAGCVIAYVGADGADVTGPSFQHGNLVSKGQKGVWAEPLDPGKYPINPHTHRLESVPTANIVLNWATGKTEAHKLDEKLSTISVRSKDGFRFNLDVSQIIHIPRNDAPKVIARFGSVLNLITQVLEPTIGNYFRNAAQGSGVMDFLKGREERQKDAKDKISAALKEYNVVAVDTLIGDIVPPEDLMLTLTDRKLAEERKTTYETQKLAEDTRKELEQAKALAATQSRVVDAERLVQIAEFDAQASIKKANGDAQSKTINAKADAEVLTTVGKAQGEKTAAVGNAEAAVIQKKTEAVGQGNYALIEIGKALAENKVKLVPDIMAGGGQGAEGGTLISVLIADLLRDKLKPASRETP
jgi:uncharacterized membrane protein YqiK